MNAEEEMVYMEGLCEQCGARCSWEILGRLDGFCSEACKAAALLTCTGNSNISADPTEFLKREMQHSIENSMMPFYKQPLTPKNISAMRKNIEKTLQEEFSAELESVRVDEYQDNVQQAYVFRISATLHTEIIHLNLTIT